MFNDIVGNEKIKKALADSVKNNRTSHSYLFVGSEGIGKKLIAEAFGEMLLNMKIVNSPDFVLIEPDGKNIKIEQIREMQTKVQEKPIKANNKVYVIDDADKMTTEAQNCLLKTLEEPPEFVTIILVGTNENAFLSTIKSRCMILHFNKISDEEMKKYLQEKLNMVNVTDVMLKMFQGSIAKAIELKDNEETYQNLGTLIKDLDRMDFVQAYEKAEILYSAKEEIQKMLEYINTILLELAKTDYRYANCISIVEDTKGRLRQNGNYDMCIDNMLWNIWREVN